jgi:hypothetical protein
MRTKVVNQLSGEKRQDTEVYLAKHQWISVLPALAYGAAVLPFIYKNALGEIDLAQMAFAIVHGAATGLREGAGFHYGYPFSFGYYYLLYHLVPHAILTNSAALIKVMNAVGFGSAVGSIALLGLYLSRLYGVGAALVVALIFAFCPLYLELGASGHPELPALFLLLLGAYLLTFATDSALSTIERSLSAITATVAILAALCIRSDVLLSLPFLAIASRSKSVSIGAHVRDMLPRILLIAVALVGFLILQRIVLKSFGTSGHEELARYLSFSDNLRLVKKGLVIIVLGTGVASIAMCAIVLAVPRLRNLAVADAVAIGSLLLLSLILWLPNPDPARHFLFLSLASALVIGLGVTRRASLPVALTIGILTPIASQALGELLYPTVVAHYDWSYRPLMERHISRSAPMGFYFRDVLANQMTFTHLRREGIALSGACFERRKLLVFADEPYYYLMALAERDGTLQIDMVQEDFGTSAVHALGRSCETVVVSKYKAWPRDVVPIFLGDRRYEGWSAYFQESTRGKWDKSEIPIDRLAKLPDSSSTN